MATDAGMTTPAGTAKQKRAQFGDGFRDSVLLSPNWDIQGKKGILSKKGTNFFKPWQKRYFVAAGHYLKYYLDEKTYNQDSKNLLGSYDLNLMDVQDCKGVEFTLKHTDGDLQLKAGNGADAEHWVDVLRKLKQQ